MPNSLNVLGLAKKAGKLETGEDAIWSACDAGVARLLVMAKDLSESARKRAELMLSSCKAVRVDTGFTMTELGNSVGKGAVSMVAITDAGLAALFAGKLCQEYPGRYDSILAVLDEKAKRIQTRKNKGRKAFSDKGKRRNEA